MTDTDERSKLYDQTTTVQRISGVAGIICAFIAVILIIVWMKGSSKENAYGGGLNFNEYLFNYHPIFMSSGLILGSLTALLSYRILPLSKTVTKSLHAILHSLCLCCVVIGLTCVIVGNNFTNKNDTGGYFPNLISLHSFVGIAAMLLYFQNYFFGFLHFLLPLTFMPVEKRKSYMPIHVFLGGFSFFTALCAVETGILDLAMEKGCYWQPTSANTNPVNTYDNLPIGCRIGNAAGIMFLIATFFGAFALFDFSRFLDRVDRDSKQPLMW